MRYSEAEFLRTKSLPIPNSKLVKPIEEVDWQGQWVEHKKSEPIRWSIFDSYGLACFSKEYDFLRQLFPSLSIVNENPVLKLSIDPKT
jgi:hypothetical protein